MKTRFPYPTRVESVAIGEARLALTVIDDLEKTIDLLFEATGKGAQPGLLEELAPYFGVVWASARALSEELSERFAPEWRSKRVLELGCGLALPSLVLAKRGARPVATDFHPDVPGFLKENLARNGLEGALEYRALDWRNPDALPQASWDLVYASDVLYELPQVEALARALAGLLSPGGVAWVADPGRPYLQSAERAFRGRGLRVDMHVRGEVFLLEIRRHEGCSVPPHDE